MSQTPPFNPQEQALIERLQNAPQYRLSASMRNRIHEKLLAEMNTPSAPIPAPAPTHLPILAILAGGAVVVSVILLVVWLIGGGNNQ
ncbi:MAG TPA: hypothetical protein PLZ51_27905, partial [Aggregatilineales bacterium]|nr:hypothetical protein [Aggregatilineales bacterium]